MDLTPLGIAAGIGYLWQWARGPKKIPNWLGYIVAGAVTIGAWVWVTPDAEKIVNANWRQAVAGIIGMYLTARGTASASSEAKIAPKTNSI
jgi:hypothetical protein